MFDREIPNIDRDLIDKKEPVISSSPKHTGHRIHPSRLIDGKLMKRPIVNLPPEKKKH